MSILRKSLLPNASSKRVELVLAKIKEIEKQAHNREAVATLIKEFNDFTGKTYEEDYFKTYWNSVSIEDFARDAAQPVPLKLQDITKTELIEIVERIRNADENTNFYLNVLDIHLPHPRISDLIFWPENEGLSDDSTSEEIVEVAMNYKVIQL